MSTALAEVIKSGTWDRDSGPALQELALLPDSHSCTVSKDPFSMVTDYTPETHKPKVGHFVKVTKKVTNIKYCKLILANVEDMEQKDKD